MKPALKILVLTFIVIGMTALSAEKGKNGKPKSARDICHRKCAEEMDRCVDKRDLSRIKCAKQEDECQKSCNQMLK